MAAIGIAIDGREESSGNLREQLEVLLTVIGPHCRSEDLIGLVDAKTMGIFLPETDLEAGRIFSERIRDAIRQGFGMPPILMYLTSLEREEGNTAQSLAVSISRAIDGMSKDKAGPNFAVNTTGKMAWR
jgi:GGDEF domain-containing protein